jgi:hypothetical protein
VRTTLTLDDDVARALRQQMRRSGQSFKATVNDALRRGLEAPGAAKRLPPFVVEARPMQLRPGLSYDCTAQLIEDIEGPMHK